MIFYHTSLIISHANLTKYLATATRDGMQRAWIPYSAVWSWKGYKEIHVQFKDAHLLTEWAIGDGQCMNIDTILRYANKWSDMGGREIPRFVESASGQLAQIRVKFNSRLLVLLPQIVLLRGTIRRCPYLQCMEMQPSCQEKVAFLESLSSCHGQHECS